MNKTLKYGLLSIGAIFVVFLALIALVAATFNPNDYKPLIIKLVQEKKQRTLQLEGDIKLTFFPRIGADLGKLSLSEHKDNKTFAAVDSVRVSLAVMPLLKKQLVVDHIRIDGIRVGLVRYADGSTSIDDLLKKEEESEQFKFDIEGVSVTHAALAIDDQMAKRQLNISELEFESGRLANNQPGKIDLKFALQNSKPKIDARFVLSSGLLFDLDTKAIALEKLMFTMVGKLGADSLDVRLASPKFELGPERADGKLDLTVKVVQPKGYLDLALSVPALSGKGSAFRAENFVLDISGKQGENTIKSQIASPFSANLDARQFSLDKLVASFNLSGPAMAKALDMKLNGAARLDLAKQNAHLNLSGKLDESQVKTRLGMNNFDSPAYDFDITIDQLDVDRYLPPARAEAKEKQSESPLDFGFLRNLSATGQLGVGALKVSNIKLSNLNLNVRAGGGNLNVAPLSANLYQGSLNGAISLHDAATPRVALKQSLVGVNINALLKDVANFDTLEGHGNVALDINAQGSTVGAMKKALQGSASLALLDGAIKGVNIAGAIKSAKAKFGSPQGQMTQTANAADKTEFSEMKASFQINNGVAHNEDLDAKSPLLRLTGNGDVNIGESAMNYLVKATVVASLEGQGGKDISALKGMTVPVRITGPFSGLKYSLDFNAMASEAVKQKVEQKKDEIKSRLGEQLKGGLKGLFK